MKIIRSGIHFNKLVLRIFLSHSFGVITLLGNLMILGFSFVFYWLEFDQNNNVNDLLDALWWGFSTATTVGYGDIIPVTASGKILGILLMLVGTALFATYTALFAQTILEDEFLRFNKVKNKNDSLEELIRKKEKLEKQIQDLEQTQKKTY